MAALKSMVMTASQAQSYVGVASSVDDAPKYPYGLQLCLDGDTLKALGLTKMPPVGETMMIMARVKVTGARENEERDGEKRIGCDLQITDMTIGEDSDKPTAEDALYGAG